MVAWLACVVGGLAALGPVRSAIAAAAPEQAVAPQQAAAKRSGRIVRIELPITGTTAESLRRVVRRRLEESRDEVDRLVLIFELHVSKEQSEYGRGSEFGACLSLAEFLTGEEVARATTVAYVPQSIQGHAVLVAIACDEIIMAEGASIGLAGVDEKVITASRRANYQEIADRRRTVPAAVALWMLDPSRRLWVVETELSREFVTAEELAELRKTQIIRSERPLFDPEQPDRSVVAQRGLLSGAEARRLGLVGYLAASRKELAEALELAPGRVDEELSVARPWAPVRVDIKGPLSAQAVSQIERMIDEEIRQRDVNFICLWIDSPGGSLSDSIRLANYLGGLDSSKVRTVAYVPQQARADAALVALACHQLVAHPDAQLGGPGAVEFGPDQARYAREALRDRQGPWRHRSWSIPAALVDPSVEVFRYQRPGAIGYFCEEELAERRADQPGAPNWTKAERITTPGKPLALSGQSALELGVVDKLVADFAELRRFYGIEDDPRLIEPGWADDLVEALASPGVTAFLLMIGFLALYVELHTPGIGIGGFLAAVCFLLFFWANYLGGTVGWLEALLFAAGVACLLLEVFVLPGFGIFGLGGGAMVLASLILASQTFVLPRNPYQFAQLQRSLLTLAAALVGFLVTAAVARRWLPRTGPFGEVVLEPPSGDEAEMIRRRESLLDSARLVGQRGVAATQLTPGGKGRFGNELVDVITDGELVPRGAAIEVVEAQGNRVLVREARRP